MTRPLRTVGRVRVSFVLRFDAEPLARGELVGDIEEVSTGRIGGVRTLDDLVGFITGDGIVGLSGRPAPGSFLGEGH